MSGPEWLILAAVFLVGAASANDRDLVWMFAGAAGIATGMVLLAL
jgi:hypothetical protein